MHRPEAWGYVQFSTSASGSVAFRPDPALPARRWLQQVYYAQREFRRAEKRWASSLGELGAVARCEETLSRCAMEVTSDLFQASGRCMSITPCGDHTQLFSFVSGTLP